MGRRDVHQLARLGVDRCGADRFDDHAFVVDRHGGQERAFGQERRARAEVAGILDQSVVARIDEQAGEKLERLLRAADDDDLRRMTADPSVLRQVLGDGRPQRRRAGGLVVREIAHRGLSDARRDGALPLAQREAEDIRQAVQHLVATRL